MDKIYIELYGAKWCGHCSTFKPEWDKMVKNCRRNELYSNFVFNYYDADLDKNKIDRKIGRGLDIQGYPTIVMCKGKNEVKEYDGERTEEEILKAANKFYKRQKGGNINTIKGNGFTYYSNKRT